MPFFLSKELGQIIMIVSRSDQTLILHSPLPTDGRAEKQWWRSLILINFKLFLQSSDTIQIISRLLLADTLLLPIFLILERGVRKISIMLECLESAG